MSDLPDFGDVARALCEQFGLKSVVIVAHEGEGTVHVGAAGISCPQNVQELLCAGISINRRHAAELRAKTLEAAKPAILRPS